MYKKLVTLLFLFVGISVYATNYYVKTGGNDAAAGTSDGTAWATITKVNAVWAAGTFAPGDNIYFNKGNTFVGTITVTESGTSGSLITIGAYGTGDAPIVTGFTDISGSWVNYSGNIYRKAVTTSSDIRYLSIEGVNYLMGRFPNTGRYQPTSAGSGYLGDATHLTQADDWWNGGEVTYRTSWYSLTTAEITDFTSTNDRILFSGTPSTSYGYFIQNNIHCLTDNGDWCWDGSYIYLYYSSDPSSLTIKVAAYDYGVNINNYDYIKIIGINITGYNVAGIRTQDGDRNVFQNNTVSRCKNGIYSYNCDYIEIVNNTISYCGYDGVYFIRSNNGLITSNVVSYIGMDAGFGYRGLNGIEVEYSYSTVMSYNDVNWVGYDGIRMSIVDDCTIEKNRVRNYCYLLCDGGGIYSSATWSSYIDANYPEASPYTGNTIRYNFVEAGDDGSVCLSDQYASGDDIWYIGGIYLDAGVSGFNVNNNICVKNWINFQGNDTEDTYFTSNWATKTIGSTSHAAYGSAEFSLEIMSGYDPPANNSITYNKFVSNYNRLYSIGDYIVRLITVATSNTFNYNYYLNPTGTYGSTGYVVVGDVNANLAGFKANAGVHAGVNDVGDVKVWSAAYAHTSRDQFVTYDYNFSAIPRNFAFESGWTYYNITTGAKLTGTYTLPAYEGAILYRINNLDDPDPYIPSPSDTTKNTIFFNGKRLFKDGKIIIK